MMGAISLSNLENVFGVLATVFGVAFLVVYFLGANRIEMLFWEEEKKLKR